MKSLNLVLAILLISLVANAISCTEVNTSNLPESTSGINPSDEQNTPVESAHDEVFFHLSSNAQPGRYSEYDAFSFPIYLKSNQELYLSFYAESIDRKPIVVSVIFPSGRELGYETTSGIGGNIKDKGLGTLQESHFNSAEEGHFLLEVVEDGFHTVNIESSSNICEIDVTVEYWVN